MRFSFGIGIGGVATLLILEALFRFMPINSGARMADTDATKPFSRYLPHQDYVYSYGWALLNPKLGISNDQGFTNSPDFHSKEGVLIVGDSYIESLMLEFKDTVQGRLNSAMHGSVYAAAASNNGLADSLKIAEHYIPDLHPKAVVFFVEPNDLSSILSPPSRGHNGFVEINKSISVVHNPYQESALKKELQKSALARYVYYNLKFPDWLSKTIQPSKEYIPSPIRDESAEKERMLRYYFSELHRQAIAGGHRVLFLLDGDRKALYADKTMEKSAWNAEDRALFMRLAPIYWHEVIDMQPIFETHWAQRRERMDYLPVDGHWNPVAHKLAADEIYKLISK